MVNEGRLSVPSLAVLAFEKNQAAVELVFISGIRGCYGKLTPHFSERYILHTPLVQKSQWGRVGILPRVRICFNFKEFCEGIC